MDPTKIACKTYNSFKESKPIYDTSELPKIYEHSDLETLTLHLRNNGRDSSSVVPIYCDVKVYKDLNVLSAQVYAMDTQEVYEEAVELADPWNEIGNSVFGKSKAAKESLKMANLDAVFKFTGHYSSLLKMRLDTTYTYEGKTLIDTYKNPVGLFKEDEKFVACVVQDMGWGSCNYLQFRLKEVRIRSMNTVFQNAGFTTPSTKYFTPTYGEDGTGDIVSNWKNFVEDVRSSTPEGIQLFIGNGLLPENGEQTFVLSEVLTGLSLCNKSATFILKLEDVLDGFYADLLYVLSQCFVGIMLFKPVMCPPESGEKYLVCLESKGRSVIGPYVKLLENVLEEIGEGSVDRFLKEDLPEDFVLWLHETNTKFLLDEIEAYRRIQKIIEGEYLEPEYNLRTALKVWSVPGNLPK